MADTEGAVDQRVSDILANTQLAIFESLTGHGISLILFTMNNSDNRVHNALN